MELWPESRKNSGLDPRDVAELLCGLEGSFLIPLLCFTGEVITPLEQGIPF